MKHTKYCTFIDVLGYGELVKDTTISIDKKIEILHSIYSNIATHFSIAIKEINESFDDKIFIRSFSDCFYLECEKLEPIIIATNRIFNWTFGFYSNFSIDEERTPLLRAGIVKDWTVSFKDIGAIINNTSELNPVGLGVANAYYTSEKSNLSGMRIIISPEVFTDLNVQILANMPIDCFSLNISENNISFPYYFRHIITDEKKEPTNLYEMIWSLDGMNDCTYDYINVLEKLKPTFKEESIRHFTETAKVLLAGLLLSDCESKNVNTFNDKKDILEKLIINNHFK